MKNKVSWPHEAILDGVSRQRVTYDQLSLTQFVQGFCKNIMEESCNDRRYTMVSYLSDLMEDATYFSWQSAKAAHAVLLCEIERGSLQWEDMDRIDRIQRAHAQKHVVNRNGWAKPSDHSSRKPWFCKGFQTGVCTHTRDHESNGKLQRHICAHCLMGGRQLNHPEKDCNFKKTGKKRASSCPSLGWSSCKSNTTVHNVKDTTYMARFFYNSAVRPRDIDNLLAKKSKNVFSSSKTAVKTHIFGRGVNSGVNVNTNSVRNKKI